MSDLSDREIRAGLRGAFGGPDSSILRRLGITPPKGAPEESSRCAGRYRIGTEIARGGVGVVYLGHDVDIGREVAMKVLRDEYCDDAAVTARFSEEAQIGGQLQHPGIAPVYEFGLDEHDRPYFAMKLIKGHTLASLWEREPQDRISFLPVFEKVCQTMAYAHARGVVHRDLKPANVMVGAFGEVQVVDWGFAKVIGRPEAASAPDLSVIATRASDDSKSEVGAILGTPAYMPPEQALGQIELIDERADVFALGAILYELLTGHPPYRGEDRLIRAARCDVDLAALDGAPDPLAGLARDCLAAAPGDRPRSAKVVAERVADYLASVEEQAHEARVERARAEVRERSERRKRRLAASMILCVVAASVVGGLAWAAFDRSEQRTRSANQRAAREAAAEASRSLGEGDVIRAHEAALRSLKFQETDGARKIEAAVRDAAAGARAAAERDARVRDLTARVEELLGEHVAHWQRRSFASNYETAFQLAGLDPRTEAGADALMQLPEEARILLAGGLSAWATCLTRGVQPEREALMGVASRIDPDPWRRDARSEFLAENREALRERVKEIRERTQAVDFTLMMRALNTFASHDAARRVAEAGVLICPDSVGLRMTAARTGPPAQRRAHLLAARALIPDDHVSLPAIVIMLREVDSETAIGIATDVLARAPRPDAGLLRAYSKALSSAGRHDEAVAVVRDAVRLFPANMNARVGEARALELAGRTDEAALTYAEATRLFASSQDAWLELAQFERRRGRHDAVKLAASEALRLSEQSTRALSFLGNAEFELGNYAEAIRVLEKLPLLPRRSAYPCLAMAYWQLGEKDRARELAAQFGRKWPEEKRAHRMIDGKD